MGEARAGSQPWGWRLRVTPESAPARTAASWSGLGPCPLPVIAPAVSRVAGACLLVTWSPHWPRLQVPVGRCVHQCPGRPITESPPVALPVFVLQEACRNCLWARPCPRLTAQASWAACGMWWWGGGHCTCWRTRSLSRSSGPVLPHEPRHSPPPTCCNYFLFL